MSLEIFEKDKKLIFDTLKKAQRMSSSSIILEIKNSGLRGRGGAGFPTGLKWEFVFKEKSQPKYIVCNAHEGEPETLKDKYLLENFPHLVLGGMLIAAGALNSKDLFITIKETYKKAIKNFKKEILIFKKSLRQGTDPWQNTKIEVLPAKLGYIGGEETALLNEIEGRRVEPRQKPPFVSTSGLFGKPTLINNVESFANIPFIVSYGAKAFRAFGTKDSPGKKLVTIAGDVKKSGVYEIDFGKNLNDVLETAGGPRGATKFVLTGGFAGTMVLPKKFSIPFEYDSFGQGLAVGAGTIIFYNEKRNLLKVMKEWLKFFKDESCGQCTPCREGTFRLFEIIENISRLRSGRGNRISPKDLAKMEEIFLALENSSFCPLGTSVPMASRGLISAFKKELVNG